MRDRTKWIAVRVALILLCVFIFAGCGQEGIEGTWILKEEYQADGTRISAEELKDEFGISERYEIENGSVTYTLNMKGAEKPTTIKLVLEELGDNRYNFNTSKGGFTFVTAEVDGDTMTYIVGEGESMTKMVFGRK